MMDGPIPPSSSSSSSTIPTVSSASSASSASAVFRPRRSDDWQQYRPIIEQLYLNNQLKLRDVKIIMERDHHFVASEKQYKDRLAAWHIRKNIKAKEVHVMIRKQQKRAARGKQTAFRVGGQEVDSKRISRFLRRYGPSWDTTKSPPPAVQATPEPDTPTDMSCYTPEPEDRSTALSPMPEIASDPREIFPSPFPHPVWMASQPSTERMLGALDPPLDLPSPHPHPHSHSHSHSHPHPHPHPHSHSHPHSHPHPHPHSHSHSHPHAQPEMADDQSLSATLSPSLTNDTPKPLDDDLPVEDPWSALVSFQERLQLLHETLEQSMSDYTTPLDD